MSDNSWTNLVINFLINPSINGTAYSKLFDEGLIAGLDGMPYGHTPGLKNITKDFISKIIKDFPKEDVMNYKMTSIVLEGKEFMSSPFLNPQLAWILGSRALSKEEHDGVAFAIKSNKCIILGVKFNAEKSDINVMNKAIVTFKQNLCNSGF